MGLNSSKWVLPSYTVTFVNEDGTVLETQSVKLGSDVQYKGSTPTKETKDWIDYKFIGWDKSTTNIIADTKFTAQYESSHQTYTMTWKDYDGSVLKTETINKGVEPEYGSIPTRPSTATTQYAFAGWKYSGDWKTGSYEATATYDEAMVGLTIENGVVKHYVGTGEVTLPSVWQGTPVTTIASYAFASSSTNGTSITKITMSDSITTIESHAFDGATELTSVTFPNNNEIKTLNPYLFNGCTSLTEVNIPDSVKLIDDYAFKGCSVLNKIKMGKNLQDFKQSAFVECPALSEVDIDPENTKFATETNNPGIIFSKDLRILIRCLPSVKALDSSKLPQTLTIVISNAFQGCKFISTIDFSNCNVIQIDDYAFKDSSIVSFVSGDNIESFGTNVFENCSNLESISLGSKVDPSKMNWDSFSGCVKLNSITVSTSNPYMSSENNIVYSKDADISKVCVLRCLPNNTAPQIKSNVTIIGENAFEGCFAIKKCDFLDGIVEVRANAFKNCSILSEVTLPNSVTKLGARVFANCSSLTKITVGTGIKFDWSGNLDFDALGGCSNLKEIVVDSANTSLFSIDGVLYAKYTNESVNDTWILKYPPAKDGTEFTIPTVANKVAMKVFADATKLESVKIPTTITHIYDYAFSNCKKLSSIESEGDFSKITFVSTAFEGCDSLETIVIDNIDNLGLSLKSFKTLIGRSTVNLKLNLPTTSLQLSNSTSYKDYIEKLIVAGETTSIGSKAFDGCYTITSIDLSSKVKEIGDYAFRSCTSLTELKFKEGLQKIGVASFQGNIGIIKLELPSSLNTIGRACFGNLNITSLNTKSVTSIDQYAFSGCTKLSNLVIGKSLATLNDYAFNGCSSLPETITYEGTEEDWNKITYTGNPFELTAVKYIQCSDKIIEYKSHR